MDIQRNLAATPGGRHILGVPNVGILAATIASQTAGGTSGPGLLYDEATNPANVGKQLRVRITSLPGSGALFVYENGSLSFSGAANGTHVIGYDVDADDVFLSSDTATVIVGAAPGATLTGTSSLSAGAAQGASQGTAPGATLAGSSDISTAGASGEGNATVAGAAITGTSTLAAGQPSASNAAAGTTIAGSSGLSSGTATGNTALGANLTGASSLVSGGANGASAAVVTNRRRNKR